MLITLITDEGINTLPLPEEPSGMRWVADSDAPGARRWALAEAEDGAWALSPRRGLWLADEEGSRLDRARIDPGREAVYRVGGADGAAALVVRPFCRGDRTYRIVGLARDDAVTIGSGAGNALRYPSRFVSSRHARIDYERDAFSVVDLSSANGTFVNGRRLPAGEPVPVGPGDVVEVLGLVVTFGHRFLSFNDPADSVELADGPNLVRFEPPPPGRAEPGPPDDGEDAECFYPAPRFKRDVVRRALSVDPPPAPQRPDDAPVAMKVGPSMAMGLAAVFSGAAMLVRMQESGGSLLSAAPMLAMAASLVLGSVLWPVLSRRFEKKKVLRAEAARRQAYAAYLDRVRARLRDEAARQREVLEENRVTVGECLRRAFERDPRLMDRTPAHDDFLEVRVGTGTVPLAADVRYPDERFSVERDDLSEAVLRLAREPKEVRDAPVSVPLAANPVVGVAGPPDAARSLVFGLVAQVACLHSYEDVKIAVLSDAPDAGEWAWARALPHAFSDDRAERYAASTPEEATELGLSLGRVAEARRGQAQGRGGAALPCYVVVCASKRLAGGELVGALARRPAPGFTVVCVAEERRDLPKQCAAIVEVGWERGAVRSRDDAGGEGLAFRPDAFAGLRECEALCRALDSVRLDVASARDALPDSLGFLEMYEAGSVGQLGVRARWAEAKASETLAARVGAGPSGEPFLLNLHERFHGPHGLVAGTTGSGKSEFLVAWVLSMCVEYSPEEAAFVLIDYKGGGLAGAFDGSSGPRLPHLAGTVTNLDGAAVARSLASLRSELRRRQALFNAARPAAGGGTVDIYRYLELFREGRAGEPCPHLFVVADEFAELKQQEPGFMEELVSAARIGRSLGVHLVLATQKPSGVVSDQIRSNSKFKVCLKVADAADSKEMIRRPDAAALSRAGRFFMLVGYSEQFSSGQAAWAGAPYEPADAFAPAADGSVELVSGTGRALASARPARPGAAAPGARPAPQLAAVLAHLAECAEEEGLSARRLWLDPLPDRLPLSDLKARYAEDFGRMAAAPFALEAAVGELDDPANQAKRLLALPLSAEGNAVVYGSAGSGAEQVASAALCSLLEAHGPEDLNVYIVDLGSEALGAFRGAPQVGDVVLSGDAEKAANLFKMLREEASSRRRRLGRFGGDRLALLEATGERMPSILVVVEGFERFCEIFEPCMPALTELSRDGARCGIWFLVTAARANGVPYRVLPNFKQRLALEMASPDEYLGVLGSLRGAVPPKGRARGLVKVGEDLLTFQGACVADGDEGEYQAICDLCESMKASYAGKADGIPVLPDRVTSEAFDLDVADLRRVPFAIDKDTIEPVFFDFLKSRSYGVLSNDIDKAVSFLSGLCRILGKARFDVLVLDPFGLLPMSGMRP